MRNFSGQDIVLQERCKIVYATFVDYIIRCFDNVKKEVYVYNPGWWNTTWDSSTNTLSNDQFELKGIDFSNSDTKLPLITGLVKPGTTGIIVKLKAEQYSKWRIYPVANLPLCNINQSWLYGLIPLNLFCTQFFSTNNFFLIKPLSIVSNLVKVNNYIQFNVAPVTNFIDPDESLTEPLLVTMALIGIDDLTIELFSIVTIENKQYIQVSEPLKHMIIVETDLYSDHLKDAKFYLANCSNNIYDIGKDDLNNKGIIDCLSSITFYDQETDTLTTKTCIVIYNLDKNGNQRVIPHFTNNALILGDITIKFLRYNSTFEEITEVYFKIVPINGIKVALLTVECDLLLIKDAKGNIYTFDMAEYTSNCIYGDGLVLTTVCDSHDDILQMYNTVRYPITYTSNSIVYPTKQSNLNACLMLRPSNQTYSVNGNNLPLSWDKIAGSFKAHTFFSISYTLLNQEIIYFSNSIRLRGLIYTSLGTQNYEVEFKYFKWDTINKVFIPGLATEAIFTPMNYSIDVRLTTNICKVRYEVWINGVYSETIDSLLISTPVCDFPRRYNEEICDCEAYFCVDMSNTMLMACEVISNSEGKALPYCMGWPGETKVHFADIIKTTCEEPYVCTLQGCVYPIEDIDCCTTPTSISQFPACDWQGPGRSRKFLGSITDYFLYPDGTITGIANEITTNRGSVKLTPYWDICNIYDFITPNEYIDIEGNSYIVDPVYFIYMKHLASFPGAHWPFEKVKISLTLLKTILPGIENIRWNWSIPVWMSRGYHSILLAPCRWLRIHVENTRDASVSTSYSEPGVSNITMVTPYDSTSLQASYDAYCDKVKWLVNEDAYAYAVYMGYLNPTVGITV